MSGTPLSIPTPAASGISSDRGRHSRWPAERFYWAELRLELPESAKLDSSGVRASLEEAFEPHLPVPMDSVAAAYMKVEGGRVIACALPVSAIEADAPGAVTLGPSFGPAWLATEGTELASLNVLTGRHLPLAVVAAQGRRSFAFAAAIAVVGGLACLGLLRRLDRTTREVDEARSAVADLQRLPLVASLPPSPMPLDQRVYAELKRLRATRTSAARSGITDASVMLEPVLRRWPADAKARTGELSVSSAGVTIGALVPGPTEADRLVTAYAQVPGWQAPRSEVSTQATGQRVRITMTPADGSRRTAP